jgi:hypothetical protein
VQKVNGLIFAGLGAGLLGLSSPASATPVTYDVYTGSNSYFSILATNAGNTLVNNGVVPLTMESFVEFDSSALTLPNLEFYNDGSVSLPITGGAFAGDSLQVTDLRVVPGTGYSSTVTSIGSGSYDFTVNTLLATGSWELLNSSDSELASGTINHTISTFNGTFGVSGAAMQNLTLSGMSLGTIDGGNITLTGSVDFNGGVVPLPAPVWLLGSGLLGLLAVGMRRRPEEGSVSHAL